MKITSALSRARVHLDDTNSLVSLCVEVQRQIGAASPITSQLKDQLLVGPRNQGYGC